MEAGAMKRSNAGVTLIEMMTVLTVLAVSLTIGLPAFADTLSRLRVQTAMHRISADLAAAPVVVLGRGTTRGSYQRHDDSQLFEAR